VREATGRGRGGVVAQAPGAGEGDPDASPCCLIRESAFDRRWRPVSARGLPLDHEQATAVDRGRGVRTGYRAGLCGRRGQVVGDGVHAGSARCPAGQTPYPSVADPGHHEGDHRVG
jgi:hypothetical protein